MRGKDLLMKYVVTLIGITPAYAGKSSALSAPDRRARDHPRLCGEKHTGGSCRFRRLGSPPPMRGKATRHIRAIDTVGITPAYAGKSTTPVQTARGTWDHPRLCGEKFVGTINRILPPGITPAYAGKSVLGDPRRLLSRDHPRLCGEKMGESGIPSVQQGSPPPMRGKEMRW